MGNQKNWTLRQLLSHPYLVYIQNVASYFDLFDIMINLFEI